MKLLRAIGRAIARLFSHRVKTLETENRTLRCSLQAEQALPRTTWFRS